MSRIFLKISEWLGKGRARLWLLLAVVTALVVFGASRLKVSEDLADFFPEEDRGRLEVLGRLRSMDRLTFILEAQAERSTDASPSMGASERLVDAGELLAGRLETAFEGEARVQLYYGTEVTDSMVAFVYRHLPILLTEKDYATVDSLFRPEMVGERLRLVRELLLSPAGSELSPYLGRDPLLLGLPVLGRLRDLGVTGTLSMDDGYLFSADGKRLLLFVDLASDFMSKTEGASVTSRVRECVERLHREDGVQGIEVYCYGAPLVTEANSECVKSDEVLTLGVSLCILFVLLVLVFRSMRSVALLFAPVAFGGLFAMAVTAAMGVELSQMALGAGATIMGLGLSYSIHVVTHGVHVSSVRQLIEEMAWPMTVGSVTTIGAFVALLFTSSVVLRDIGLFASLTLVGTLVFCLVFLPPMVKVGASGRGWAFGLMERVAGYDYSRNKWLVGGLTVVFVVSLFFFNDVRFNCDMSGLNYEGDRWLQKSLTVMEETLGIGGHESAVVVTGGSAEALADNAERFSSEADSLLGKGLVSVKSIGRCALPSRHVASERAELWNKIFSGERVDTVLAVLRSEGRAMGFAEGAFDGFARLVRQKAEEECVEAEELMRTPVFSEWVSEGDGELLMSYRLEVDMDVRDEVFSRLGGVDGCVVADMGYYSREATRLMVDDFNWLLWLSSVIVAVALILSYGRVELFLLTFMPMVVGWVIILGLMAIFGVEFNVVNIILSTFIFGVGDDYSIFIMDGLQGWYARGRRVMAGHKTAIMLSALAAMAGLGAQVFGRHPAVHSLGMISIFGLAAVIVTSFVVQPVLFRLLITNPVERGGVPYTLASLVRGVVAFGLFGLCCLVCEIVAVAVWCVVRDGSKRRRAVRTVAWRVMRAYLWVCRPILRVDSPDVSRGGQAVVVCNHQSFLDILSLMGASPNLVFVVKGWVRKSVILGPVAEAMGFVCVDDGEGGMVMDGVRRAVAEGCSVVVFPEGSRSADCRVRRFHKGAVYMASAVGLPLRPVVFYGNGLSVSKNQPLNLMRCELGCDVLDDVTIGKDVDDAEVKTVTKHLQEIVSYHLAEMRKERDAKNIYYRDLLSRGYIYRGIKEYKEAVRIARTAAEIEIPATDANGSIDVGASPLGLRAYWIALLSDAKTITATVESDEEAEYCRRSPLSSYLASRGREVLWRVIK